MLAYLVHHLAPLEIALGESPPVSESTVWRGIRQARAYNAENGDARLIEPEPEAPKHHRQLLANVSRRRTKPRKAEEVDD